ITPPFAGNIAIVDALCAGPNAIMDEQLITPSFNATGLGRVFVEFYNRFLGSLAPNNIVDLDVSLDGGTTWLPTHVQRFQGIDEGFQMPTTRRFDITPFIAANPSNVEVRLHYTGVGVGGPSFSQNAPTGGAEVSWAVDFSIYYFSINPTNQSFQASGG